MSNDEQTTTSEQRPAVATRLDRGVVPLDPKREAVRALVAEYASLLQRWREAFAGSQEVANLHATFKARERQAGKLFEDGAIADLLLMADRYATLRAAHAQDLCAHLYGQDTPCDLPADWGRELDEWLDAERHNV